MKVGYHDGRDKETVYLVALALWLWLFRKCAYLHDTILCIQNAGSPSKATKIHDETG